MTSVGITPDATAMTVGEANADGTKLKVTANHPDIHGAVQSEVVYFPLGPGELVPAWSQVTFTSGKADWYTLVDARTGTLLWRKNIRSNFSSEEARFSVYVQADGKTPADSPSPLSPTTNTPGSNFQPPEIPRTIVSMAAAQNLTASPNGWIPDGSNTTTGNNVDAYLDRDSDNIPDPGTLGNNGRPVGNLDSNNRARDFLGANFIYTPPPSANNPEAGSAPTDVQHQRGVVAHLFYLTNWYHDQLFTLGFDEAAGNFQTVNFSDTGEGGDAVLAEAQDAAGDADDGSNRNNANFSTPPDGQPGRMQMYIFTGPTVDRDGSFDAEIVFHELTHGLSNRLIGNGNGLVWSAGQGMGEGWSDFYALSLLNNTNQDDPNGAYASGAYATYKLGGLQDNYLYGIRRFPYSTNNTVNPLTWADVDDFTNNLSGGIPASPLDFNGGGAFEVHNIGEVWALTLWEVRSRVIADPAGANGDVPTGNHTMLQLVTDALKMTPINPTFTSARDAILDADLATNNGANENSIWAGFADRGLGYNALAPLGQVGIINIGHAGLKESFSLPYLDADSVTIDDSLGNNNGAIDPGEPIRLSVTLKNPWRSATKNVSSATATLSTNALGVVILDGASTYPAIPAQGSATGDTLLFTVPVTATAGQSLDFTITTTSTLGTKAVDFKLRVGTPGGLGTPVTYTRSAVALAIPDNTPRGVFDTLSITDDLDIADLNFRVNSLTHTFTGDLTVMLRAPGGYGNDLIWCRQTLYTNGGDGDNFVNTVIDDQATADLNQSTSAQAPFTGSWRPAFNSPIWNLFNDPSIFPDPVGQLGRLNGTSTKGNWNVLVSDVAALDIGTLNSWSLIVTPRSYSVQSFTPANLVTGTQTVAGTFAQSGTVTYTVVLTNSGSAVQGDNPGNEFTEVLPAQLTLVSAQASPSGTAVAAIGTNTVTWNGSLTPAASVTITITAKVKAGTGGQTVSAQGTISYDADVNESNEATSQTDDPNLPGLSNPTIFDISRVDQFAFFAGKKGLTYNPLSTDPPPAPGQTFTITEVTDGEHGTVVINPDGTVTYTPDDKLPYGGDKFTYTVSDQNGVVYVGEITVRDFADGAATYNGLVQAAPLTTPGNERSGILRVTTSKKGMFTASLRLAAHKFSIKGRLDALGIPTFGKDAAATAILKRKVAKGQPALPDLAFTFRVTQNTDLDQLTGTVTEGGNAFAVLAADRALYTSKKKFTAPLIATPVDLIRKYTLFLSKPNPNGGLGLNQFPQGEGAAVATISKKGTIKIVGKMADGTKVSFANSLSRTNTWPFYVSFFKGKGSALGNVTVQEAVGVSDFDGLGLAWFKSAGITKQKYYPAGWPAGITTNMRGSKFDLPPKGVVASVLPNLIAAAPTGNTDLRLSNGELNPPTIVAALNVSPKNKVTPADPPNGPAENLKLKLSLKKTGVVSGKFVHPVSEKAAPIYGVIFQKTARVYGHFLSLSEAGEMTLTPK